MFFNEADTLLKVWHKNGVAKVEDWDGIGFGGGDWILSLLAADFKGRRTIWSSSRSASASSMFEFIFDGEDALRETVWLPLLPILWQNKWGCVSSRGVGGLQIMWSLHLSHWLLSLVLSPPHPGYGLRGDLIFRVGHPWVGARELQVALRMICKDTNAILWTGGQFLPLYRSFDWH